MTVNVTSTTRTLYWPQCDVCGEPGRGRPPVDAQQLEAFTRAHEASCA